MSTPSTLLERDAKAVAGVEKLRFFPLAVTAGEGCWLIEDGGRRLLDLSATWTACAFGHGHPRICEAIARAAAHPAGASGQYAVHPDSVGFAEELLALTPGPGDRCVYFGHSGTDANDVALRACRAATGKRRVIAFKNGYHGGMGVAMRVSGVHINAGVSPDPDLFLATYPNPFRPHVGGGAPALASAAASLEEVAGALAAGDVACVIAEPIQSDGGLIVPPRGFLKALGALCRRYAAPLIVDEVKVGLGRSGRFHCFEHDDLAPDIVTFGKAIGGGLPLSAAVGPQSILGGPPASALSTTAGNPICTAVGREALRTLVEEELPERARRAGERFMAGLRAVMAESDIIGDVRGRGLAIGVELVADRASNRPDHRLAQKAVYRAFELGAVVHYVGGNVIEITPPLVISDEEIDIGVEILGAAVADAAAGEVSDEKITPYAGW